METRPTTRPAPKSFFPIKSIGCYVGIAVDPKVDQNKVGKDCYNAGYNRIVAHVTSAFGNIEKSDPTDKDTKLWPFKWLGTHFDYLHIDPDWKACLFRFVESMAFWRVAPHLKLVDQFHSTGDSPGPDPFREGCKSEDEECWYSSYNYRDGKFYWLGWDDVGNTQKNFRYLNDFGRGMGLYVDAVIDVCKQVKALYPDFHFSVAWANETMCEFELVGTKWKATQRKRGDRDEVVNWMLQKWLAAGFNWHLPNGEPNPNFQHYFDYIALTHGAHKSDPNYVCYPMMEAAYVNGIAKKWKSNIEIHGILTVADCQKFVDLAKIPKNRMLDSTDGDLAMIGAYLALGHSDFNVDLKLDIRKGQVWSVDDYMKNWLLYFPKYRSYVL